MPLKTLLCGCVLALTCSREAAAAVHLISGAVHHLGTPGAPEWESFAGKTPEGTKLRLAFAASRNEREFTLLVRQDDVKQDWTVTLNGQKLGLLFPMEARLMHTLPIPKAVLHEGENLLEIAAKTPEDVVIDYLAIADDAKTNLLSAQLELSVTAGTQPIPARFTIVDSAGALAALVDHGPALVAARPGVVYAGTGRALVGLSPGSYTIYATRGPEYTIATNTATLRRGETRALDFVLQHAAETTGWVACDTHVHTLSLSKHGDATIPERLVTLAGEGVELAVNTEHNLNADFRPAAAAAGLDRFMTLIPGNEVTTTRGHFNIFPVSTNAPAPNSKIEDWGELLSEIRKSPGVQVVVLNHPRDEHNGFTPFASTNLSLTTGQPLRPGFDFSFDAMEVINSGAMRSDWMEPFQAWFALLNRGYRITGVAASDSHDVSRFIVGQGRTYIQVEDTDPGKIDVRRACAALKAGRALASLGLICRLTLSSGRGTAKAGPGELLHAQGDPLFAHFSLDAPLAPGAVATVRVYANGYLMTQFSEPLQGRAVRFTRELPKLAHDAFLVAMATIPHNPEPEWGLARPYQPTSKSVSLQMIGATNPIWVDADGDGKFSSARDYATQLLAGGLEDSAILEKLRGYDSAVAAQCIEQMQQRDRDRSGAK